MYIELRSSPFYGDCISHNTKPSYLYPLFHNIHNPGSSNTHDVVQIKCASRKMANVTVSWKGCLKLSTLRVFHCIIEWSRYCAWWLARLCCSPNIWSAEWHLLYMEDQHCSWWFQLFLIMLVYHISLFLGTSASLKLYDSTGTFAQSAAFTINPGCKFTLHHDITSHHLTQLNLSLHQLLELWGTRGEYPVCHLFGATSNGMTAYCTTH